jgi:hypothetical protein
MDIFGILLITIQSLPKELFAFVTMIYYLDFYVENRVSPRKIAGFIKCFLQKPLLIILVQRELSCWWLTIIDRHLLTNISTFEFLKLLFD